MRATRGFDGRRGWFGRFRSFRCSDGYRTTEPVETGLRFNFIAPLRSNELRKRTVRANRRSRARQIELAALIVKALAHLPHSDFGIGI